MAPRIAAITATSVIIADLVAPGTASEFHFVWLRDNCPCARCLHPTNRQKLHNSFQVPTDIAPVSVAIDGAALVLEWDRDLEPLHLDGETPKSRLATPHRTELPLERLIAGAYLTTKQGPAGTVALPSSHARVPFPPVVWDRPLLEKSPDLFVDFADICPSNHPSPAFETIEPGLDRGLYRFLKQLSDYGLCIVRGVPASTGNKLGIEAVAERIGPILETFYGRTWDVKSIERSNNIAYTNVELGLHTDLWWVSPNKGAIYLPFLAC